MNTIYCLNIIEDKTPPDEFLLFKFGENPSYHFGTGEEDIMFSPQDAYKFLANNKNKKVMVDYDHGSLMTNSPNPSETSKAAGFGYLKLKDDGLYLTNIEWTPPAADKLKNGEFQYMSPAYEQNEHGEMDRFINVALTNLPALQNNAEILNQRGKTMADKNREQELEAELEAMKLSQKKMMAQFEAMTQAQELNDIKAVVVEAVQLGQVGKAEEVEYSDYGVKYGKEALVKMLSKLPKQLPQSNAFAPKQPKADPTVSIK